MYTVRPTDTNLSPAISIHEIGAVGATKTERTGIMQLKSEMKQVKMLPERSPKILSYLRTFFWNQTLLGSFI